MPLEPGARLGTYQIVAPLGSGGMGEVYRARDPRLGRDIAIKVLPPQFAHDPDSRSDAPAIVSSRTIPPTIAVPSGRLTDARFSSSLIARARIRSGRSGPTAVSFDN